MAVKRRSGGPDELGLFRQVAVFANRIGQAVDRQLARDFEVSLTELLVLLELRDGDPRGMRIQDLASAVGLDQSSMSRLTARLEAKGLTTRVSCDYDRRGVYCGITPAGKRRGTEAEQVCRRELAKAFDAAAFDDRTASLVAKLRYAPEPTTSA